MKMPEPVAWHNHPDFPSIKWSDLELRFIEQRDAQWKDALRDVLEQAAVVCDAISADYWKRWKGTHPTSTQGSAYNPDDQGRSDGAQECADAIRAMKEQIK